MTSEVTSTHSSLCSCVLSSLQLTSSLALCHTPSHLTSRQKPYSCCDYILLRTHTSLCSLSRLTRPGSFLLTKTRVCENDTGPRKRSVLATGSSFLSLPRRNTSVVEKLMMEIPSKPGDLYNTCASLIFYKLVFFVSLRQTNRIKNGGKR